MCLTSALIAFAGSAAVPVVGVEHGDVATLVLQVHVLLQLLQRLVHTHVGVGEVCAGRRDNTNNGSEDHSNKTPYKLILISVQHGIHINSVSAEEVILSQQMY